MIRRRSRPIAYVFGIIVSGIVCFVSLRHNTVDEKHFMRKRSIGFNRKKDIQQLRHQPESNLDSVVPEASHVPQMSPGRLVCDVTSARRLIVDGGDGEGPLISPDELRPPRRRPIVRDTKRYIGCCPPGDSNGQPFRTGMACCIDQVYNATVEFCCLSRSMKLANTVENRRLCSPPEVDNLVCRVEDLGLDALRPLDVKCSYDEGKQRRVRECVFVCPPGSQVRGDKRARCGDAGTWLDADPQCCEGCPTTFTHDIWFVVEANSAIGRGNLSSIRTFIRRATGFLPISQTQVRVAATAFNQDVITDGRAWSLDQYNTAEELNSAINNLPRQGNGRNTVAALEWVANNTFRGMLGDRFLVENLVVLITTAPPDDGSLREVAAIVRDLARFMIIAVGPDAVFPEFRHSVSPPSDRNYFRVTDFQDLDSQNSFLYDVFCQEHCLS